MGDHNILPTCVSVEPHGPTADSPGVIADFTAHYFGCIKISERAHFFDKKKNYLLWNHEHDTQLAKLHQQNRDMPKERRQEMAELKVDEKIKGLAVKIESQYKRTDILRKALSGVKCSICREKDKRGEAHSTTSSPEGQSCDLVSLVHRSHNEWKDSEEYRIGIDIVRRWKQSTKNNNDDSDHTASDSEGMAAGRKQVRNIIEKYHTDACLDYSFKVDENTHYELERDTNAYIIQWEVLTPWAPHQSQQTSSFPRPSSPFTPPTPAAPIVSNANLLSSPRASGITSYFEDQGTPLKRPSWNVRLASTTLAPSFYETSSGPERYLKPVSEGAADCRFKGLFPDQRTSLKNLLAYNPEEKDSDVILNRERHAKEPRVRYIHIPHNNMKTHSQMVLRPEYWRGQQHGGRRTLVHARHMRAICERISSSKLESFSMPFLHWEEDRKRDKIAKIIEQETRISERMYPDAFGRDQLRVKTKFRFPRPDKSDESHHQHVISTWQKNSSGRPDAKHARNFAEYAGGFIPESTIEHKHVTDDGNVWRVAKLKCDTHGRVRTENKLGQFLLDAAKLYEAISMYRDQQLVEKYLHHDPPLHPRRTLDQSYYWTLKSTKARDRDQVVYRGTTMDGRDIHRLCKAQGARNDQGHAWHLRNLLGLKKCACPEAPADRQAESCMGLYKWDGHWVRSDGDVVCDHCKGEIRKVSRIVMVDQLWMWILDRKTIITSFPKRYGTNKSDPSGVHNSIRTRIKNARKNQIRSVFDVALIILDECSNTFFDRTKTSQNKQTMSFQHLWHWTERASKIYNSKSKYEDTAQLHASLLNISPEGKLQREIRDIIDELDIMIHVNHKQKEVIKRFVKNVENIYDPSGTWRDETLSPDGERDYLRSRCADDNPQSKGRNREPKSKEDKKQLEREKDEFTWFRKQAYDLISDVGDRIAELEGLRKSAESTSQGTSWTLNSSRLVSCRHGSLYDKRTKVCARGDP
ncbi:hypothetical protein LZ31DRAFT_581266 [Colletotrichum somersetense]|nr:hypothetical protein LZ31DRAFT_581266 [Colletotrichum somersetense]